MLDIIGVQLKDMTEGVWPLLARVDAEASLDLLNAKYIHAWGDALRELPLSRKQLQAIRNFIESAHRIAKRRVQVTTAAGSWRAPLDGVVINEEVQHMLYDLYESYYQSVYNVLSKLAAVVVVFPETFGSVSVRSMQKFLKHFSGTNTELTSACDVLESARKYRTLLDHPAGSPVSNWMTFRTGDDRGIVVFHHGKAGRSGAIPEGTEPAPDGFPIDADWYVDPPFVPHVDAALAHLMGVLFRQIQDSEIEKVQGVGI